MFVKNERFIKDDTEFKIFKIMEITKFNHLMKFSVHPCTHLINNGHKE